MSECDVDEIFEVFRMLSYTELKEIMSKIPNGTSPGGVSIEFTNIADKIIIL